jgi:hypothetical protein
LQKIEEQQVQYLKILNQGKTLGLGQEQLVLPRVLVLLQYGSQGCVVHMQAREPLLRVPKGSMAEGDEWHVVDWIQ